MKTFYSFLVVALLSASSVFATTPTFSNVLGFDATNAASLVDCTAQADFSPTSYTVELWANVTGNLAAPTLISNGQAPKVGTVTQNQGFTIRLNATTHVLEATIGVAIAGAGSFFNVFGTTPLTFGTWYHIALVVDGASATPTATLYLNNAVEVTVPFASGASITPSTMKLYMGEHPYFPGRRLTGQLSDVRVWNIVRSLSDIQSTMNDFLTGTEPGLVANWKLDDNNSADLSVKELKNAFPATRGAGTTWISTASKINEVSATNINVWPSVLNAGEMLNVGLDSNSSVRIFTAQGKVVRNTTAQGEGNLKKIDTSNLKSGMYMLNIISNEKNQIAKFVIR